MPLKSQPLSFKESTTVDGHRENETTLVVHKERLARKII